MSDHFSTAMNHAHVEAEDTITTGDVEPPKATTPIHRILSIILHQWLLIGIGLVCLLAYYFPSVAKHDGLIRSEYSILYGALAVIFLISGLSIPRQKLVTHMLNWRLHILVQGTSYLVVPTVVVALVHLVLAADPSGRIDRAVLAGYILTACIPTTIASNVVMTRAAGGDDAAALVEVLMGNIFGPFVTPGWTVTLMPRTAEFDPWRSSSRGGGGNLNQMYRDVFKQLGLSMLLPLLVGQLIRWTWPDKTAKAVQRFYLAKVATGCLLLLIWSTFSTCFATHALQSLSTETIIFTIFFNIALYIFLTLVCFLLSRPPRKGRDLTTTTTATSSTGIAHRILTFSRIPSPEETIAICFCGPAKSTAVGITLLYAMWGSGSGSSSSVDSYLKAKMSVPVLLYTIEQVCVAHFFVYVFARWKRRRMRGLSKICVEGEGGGEHQGGDVVEDLDGCVEEEEKQNDNYERSGSSRTGVVGVDDVEKGWKRVT